MFRWFRNVLWLCACGSCHLICTTPKMRSTNYLSPANLAILSRRWASSLLVAAFYKLLSARLVVSYRWIATNSYVTVQCAPKGRALVVFALAMDKIYFQSLASPSVGTGARARLDLQQFIFFCFTFEQYKVWQQSLVPNIFTILRTTIINISLIYI